jgi:hypothetical protein
MTREKDLKMSVPEFTTYMVVMALIFISIGGGIGYAITYDQMNKNCPEYDDITIRSHDRAIAEQLNQIATFLNEWRDTQDHECPTCPEFDDTEVLERLDEIMDKLNSLPIDETHYIYPRDVVDFIWVNQFDSFRFKYYDNDLKVFLNSPIFEVQNWTEMIDWVVAEQTKWPGDVFSHYQLNRLIMMAMDLAYYKETGTWLGE